MYQLKGGPIPATIAELSPAKQKYIFAMSFSQWVFPTSLCPLNPVVNLGVPGYGDKQDV